MYAFTNKYFLIADLKPLTFRAVLICGGKLFHSKGAAYENDLSPYDFVLATFLFRIIASVDLDRVA